MTEAIKFTPEQEAEFKKEIEEYRTFKPSRWSSITEEELKAPAYIISMKWYKNWKNYIGVPNKMHTFSHKTEESEMERVHPGPIDNKNILEEKKDYYESPDEDDIYNLILKPELREKVDYKILNEKQWNFLYKKYGGSPIKRKQYKGSLFGAKVEVYFFQLKLLILPNRDEFDIKKITRGKVLYCSKMWSLGELKERMVKILNSEKYGFKISKDKLRLWKLSLMEDIDATLNDVAKVLKPTKLEPMKDTEEKMKDINEDKKEEAKANSNENEKEECDKNANEIKKENEEMKMDIENKVKTKNTNEKDENVEENAGIEFPGTPLDSYGQDALLEKTELGHDDEVILETANDKNEYIFKFRKNAKVMRCQYCYHYLPVFASCKCNEAHYCSLKCMKKDEADHHLNCKAVDISEDLKKYKRSTKSNMGLTGLQNLGNTCFMNSGLQCLSNTWQLSAYFLKDLYLPEINVENKFGLQGKMAYSFAKLIKLLWYDSERAVSPWDLKRVLGIRHSTFCGFSQQDSQELISAILDTLHEDLNRVKNKPYVEQKTITDPEDESYRDPCWYNYLARNRSIVIDLFYGQYKSVLQCPDCKNYSITYDPYSVLSLPIPKDKKAGIIINYVPYDLKKKITRTVIIVEKQISIDKLRDKLVTLLNVKKYGSIFTIISDKSIKIFLNRKQIVKAILKMQNSNSFLYIQEIDPKYFDSEENVGIEERMKESDEMKDGEKIKKDIVRDSNEKSADEEDYHNGLKDEVVFVPISINNSDKQWKEDIEPVTFERVLCFKKSDTLKQLYMEVFRYLRPLFEEALIRKETPNEDSKENPSPEERKYMEMSDKDLFDRLFPDLTEENLKEKIKDCPYELKCVNVAEKGYYNKKECFYCGDKDCENCLVPFSDTLRIGDMIEKLDKKDGNSYFYPKNGISYSGVRNEFALELVFNKLPEKSLVNEKLFEVINIVKMNQDSIKLGVNIYDCLDAFLNLETLDENNLWYCPVCKKSVAARKKLELTRAPPILILHLKRFKSDRYRLHFSKRIDTRVGFPLTGLNISKYMKNAEILYDLYAVSNHYGSIGFGHYTAFAWNKEGKGWYDFNDSSVSSENEANICSSAAYVLFYKRKDVAEEVDYEKIKQSIPNDYVIPVIDLEKSKEKKTESKNTMTTKDSITDISTNVE